MLSVAPKLLNTEESGLRYCTKAAPFLKPPRVILDSASLIPFSDSQCSGHSSSPAAAVSFWEKSRIYGFRSLSCRVLPSYGYSAPLEEENECFQTLVGKRWYWESYYLLTTLFFVTCIKTFGDIHIFVKLFIHLYCIRIAILFASIFQIPSLTLNRTLLPLSLL